MSEETKVKEAFEDYIHRLVTDKVNPNSGQVIVLQHAFYEGAEAMLKIMVTAGAEKRLISAADNAIKEISDYNLMVKRRIDLARRVQ